VRRKLAAFANDACEILHRRCSAWIQKTVSEPFDGFGDMHAIQLKDEDFIKQCSMIVHGCIEIRHADAGSLIRYRNVEVSRVSQWGGISRDESNEICTAARVELGKPRAADSRPYPSIKRCTADGSGLAAA
jgi:hypothetical protein